MRALCDTFKTHRRTEETKPVKSIKRSEPDVSSASPAAQADKDPLLTSGKAAAICGVASGTMRRWAEAGKITVILTLGGHRRYRESEVRRIRREQVATA